MIGCPSTLLTVRTIVFPEGHTNDLAVKSVVHLLQQCDNYLGNLDSRVCAASIH